MKNFLWHILWGGCLFLVLFFFIESVIIPNIPNEYSYKYDYINARSDEISILLIGNSYFENSVNPNIIGDSCFDLASSGRWIGYDHQLIERFVPKMQNLHTVIYPLGYKIPFIGYYPESWSSVDFYHEKYMHVYYDHFPYNFYRWFAIKYSDRIGFKPWGRTFAPTWKGDLLCEGHTNENWKNEQNISPEIINLHEVNQNIANYKEHLTDIARICNQNNVRFIVVTPPCHDSFNDNVRREGIDTIFSIVEDVRKLNPLEYKSYLFDDEFRADSLYYNCSHLNRIGANKFALRLKEDFDL